LAKAPKQASRGEINNFTGIDSPFEAPEHPEMVLHGATQSPERMAEEVYKQIFGSGLSYTI
jgi:bifunctional enzyme CysN/CysC